MDPVTLWILSYDVASRDRSTAVRVCHLLFGRKNTTTRGGQVIAYKQGGFVDRPGVLRIGQSVFLLPKNDAFELRDRLEALGTTVVAGRIMMMPEDLESFQHALQSTVRIMHAPSRTGSPAPAGAPLLSTADAAEKAEP